MTLTSSLQISTSGLQAAQAALTAISDNISNVNTAGYTRKTVIQSQRVVDGAGAGVDVSGIKRVTDQYLQTASLTAGSSASSANIYSQFLDNAQTLFGDPTLSDYFFNMPDQISAAFASAANDPSSSLLRGQAVTTVQNFLDDADRINTQINQLSASVDGKVSDDVNQVNSLLKQIDSLNTDIGRASISGADATGSQNQQSQLINQLATLMNVKVSALPTGGVTIRTQDGVLLAGGISGPSTVTYNNSGNTPGYLSVVTGGANSGAQAVSLSSGEIGGLLALKNTKLPGLSDQLGEFVSRAAQQLNAASNASSAYPPPASLTGRDTGLDLPTAVSGFSGVSTIAVTNASGVVQKTVAIDFTAGTMSVNGGAGTAFTPANFLTSLNTALGAAGSASFSNRALTLSATGGNGIAIDAGTAQKAGMAFSQFFGMNDIVSSTGLSTYDTGLKSTDANGFTPGSTITLQVSTSDGKPLQQVAVAVPGVANPTVGDLVNALNSSATGVGLYGAFTLDAQGGLAFTGTAPQNATVSVVQDTTQRGVGGPSISQLFGIGQGVRSMRAGNYQVSSVMANNPTLLPFGKLNLGVGAGQSAITPGDGTGAQALANAEQSSTLFKAAGNLGAVTMTLSGYAAEFGGSVGRDAATASSNAASAHAVQTEADAKRASVEGVNLDEELINLTTFQQAYSANARMIQATKDMFNVLVGLLN